MLSRKHYKAIASIIKDSSVEIVDETTQGGFDGKEYSSKMYINKELFMWELSRVLKEDNELFNCDKFYKACNDD